jgi:hypothetical protein
LLASDPVSDPLVKPAVPGAPASAVSAQSSRRRTPIASVGVVAAESALSIAVFVTVHLTSVSSFILLRGSRRRPVPGVPVTSGLSLSLFSSLHRLKGFELLLASFSPSVVAELFLDLFEETASSFFPSLKFL